MRTRMVAVVLLVAATARAQVQVVRYDATFADRVHSALCVIPMRAAPVNGARFVCIYAIPGQPKQRDNTDGSLRLRDVKEIDIGFNEWLTSNRRVEIA